jgi:class 3 adenylate cyclase
LDIGTWLHGLALEQYEPVFRDNAIDLETLPDLTETDLEKLGVLLGHRKRIVRAIDDLRAATAPPAALAPAGGSPLPHPHAGHGRVGAGAEAERRQLTVMFCDLVGSTPLSTRFDPEDLREIVGVYHRCVADTVGRFGGFIAKYMGDGVLIYFGYPEAHEYDAERAARAGLAVIEAVGRLATP